MGSTAINRSGGTSDMNDDTSLVHELIGDAVVVGAWHNSDKLESEYYAAVKGSDGILAVVALVSYNPVADAITIKLIDEWMGPRYYNCPAEVLDALDPPPNKYAAEWRAKCKAKI